MNGASVTYKSLFSLVQDQINSKITFNTRTSQASQLDRTLVSPSANASNGTSGASSEAFISAVSQVLQSAVPPRIVYGLTVKATNPTSNQVTVAAGKGVVGGATLTLDNAFIATIPFDGHTSVFYINLDRDSVTITPTKAGDVLVLAKIVVPDLNVSDFIQDSNDGSGLPYIVQFRVIDFYGDEAGFFEEDTLEMMRTNIGNVLSDNLIGDIKLSENLRIINTSGSLSLNSDSLKLFNTDSQLLALFNSTGTFYYNAAGIEIAKFAVDEARVGNISIIPNAIQSANFVSGSAGFRIKDSGNAEFNDITVRGTIYATLGLIGGFTIASDKLYGGTIQTSETAGSGSNGVVMDSDGLRGYNDVLGLVFNLPTDGTPPTFSSGVIQETVFEIDTNSVMRTSDTVGDGTANSYGILINNTGVYGCGANQTLAEANLKALADGTVSLSGIISASSGDIGGVTITSDGLSGGLIRGTTIITSSLQSADSVPMIKMDATGIYYLLTNDVGSYGEVMSGGSGFYYGSGTKYGTGVTAYLFNQSFPALTINSLFADTADIRLYNRNNDPITGTQIVGDFIVTNGVPKFCVSSGTPGTFRGMAFDADSVGGSGDAGSGKQYVSLNIGGTVYKLLYTT